MTLFLIDARNLIKDPLMAIAIFPVVDLGWGGWSGRPGPPFMRRMVYSNV